MENDPKYNDVLQLLKKLKDTNGTYPQELLAIRRQGYLKQVAEVAGGAGLAMGLRNTVRNARGASGLPPVAGTLLEGLLVFAIVAESATLTYFNRAKIVEYFQNFTNQPRVEEVANPPILSSPSPVPTTLQVTPSPMSTETLTISGTPVITVTSTLQLAGQPTVPSTGQGSDGSGGGQAASTSVPSGDGTSNDDNGNHYGQTPIPERTKEPGNDNNSDSTQDTQPRNGNRNR